MEMNGEQWCVHSYSALEKRLLGDCGCWCDRKLIQQHNLSRNWTHRHTKVMKNPAQERKRHGFFQETIRHQQQIRFGTLTQIEQNAEASSVRYSWRRLSRCGNNGKQTAKLTHEHHDEHRQETTSCQENAKSGLSYCDRRFFRFRYNLVEVCGSAL